MIHKNQVIIFDKLNIEVLYVIYKNLYQFPERNINISP